MRQTKKQIEINCRNKISKEYNNKIKILEKRIEELENSLKKEYEIKQKIEELEEENFIYKDWIDRLLNFCDLNDEDRKNEIELIKSKKEIENSLNKTYEKIHNLVNHLNFL